MGILRIDPGVSMENRRRFESSTECDLPCVTLYIRSRVSDKHFLGSAHYR